MIREKYKQIFNIKIFNNIKKYKFFIILIFIYCFCVVGVTYAYFAFNYENTSTIVGNVVNIDATLSVEKVVGTDEKLVPMMDAALSNAINGVGSENGACIDSLGNLSCQVYKITLTNNATRLQHLVGTIELYAKNGAANAYSNLKWQELTDVTTVKSDSIINGMTESILVSGLTMESKETKTWYVGVWLSEIESDQRELDKGEFGGTVTFEVNEDIVAGTTGEKYAMNALAKQYMITDAISDVSIDFSKTSQTTGTNGIYVRNGTQNDPYPIYYYRGAVSNNLVFANFCWKVVRTTDTGGLKLIYNGVPTIDGENISCDNNGEESQIGTSSFNTNYKSPAYVGSMYSNPYTVTNKNMNSDTTEYVYGNNVSYMNGTYTLTGETISGMWADLYESSLNNYHYTCFTTDTICSNGEVYYVYNGELANAYYMTLTGGVNIDQALDMMLGSDTELSVNYNTISSTIKGNSQIEGTLDYWYYTYIDQAGYDDYVEDTVWCYDRSEYSVGGFSPTGGVINLAQNDGIDTSYIFSPMGRIHFGETPNLTCPRAIDRFTVKNKNGNKKLDYPVGLLTYDEAWLAGGHMAANETYYLNSGSDYWGGSPVIFSYVRAAVSVINYDGSAVSDRVCNINGVRPVISLKNGFAIESRDSDGSVDNPYIVVTD